jgi:nicotinate-nucleotide--dimethylbenzimidazole phosphoribosyltransferase
MTTPEVRHAPGPRDPSNDERAILDLLAGIGPLDADAMAAAEALLDRLTKPPGSLGRLESLVVQLAGITGRTDAPIVRRSIVVAAGDHGVTRHGVSAYPSDVTAQMVANFVAGGAAINVLAAEVGATVVVVDVGVAGPIPAADRDAARGGRLVEARIREGTSDMTEGPAMSRAEALWSIRIGLDLVTELRAGGLDLVGLGEMGIGNTTAASAITAVLTGRPAGLVTGRGTGVDADGHRRKVAAIECAIEVNRPDASDPIGVLAAVGGLEICVLVGVIAGAAAAGIPVVLDGFITGSAALITAALQPAVVPRLIAGHRSPEPGHAVILDHLGLAPVLDLELRLGEGSGAALAIGLVSAAVAIRDGMATFESAAVSAAILDSADATRPA